MKIPISRADAIRGLWERGILHWKLHAAQKDIYQALQTSTHKKTYLNCSRRWGKSLLFCVLAIEHALKNNHATINYVAPFKEDASEIACVLMDELLVDCPEHLRPAYVEKRRAWEFPSTGSAIRFRGANNDRARFLRGRKSHLTLIDEAADINELLHVLNAILLPQTLNTGGRLLIASTPAKSPGHESTLVARDCEAKGAYFKFTIHENPLVDEETKRQYCDESGGEESTTWRREYLCEFVTDTDRAVIPEFNDRTRDRLVQVISPPPNRDLYVGLDLGQRDLTYGLGGWWWFEQQKLVLEWEFAKRAPTTEDIAKAILAQEQEIWGRPAQRRLSDHDLRLFQDLRQYGLSVEPAQRHNKEANLSLLRTWLAQEKILIHPRCRLLIATLLQATWNKSRTQFERYADIGHADALDALLYLFRGVNQNRRPPGTTGNPETTWLHGVNGSPVPQAARELVDSLTSLPADFT